MSWVATKYDMPLETLIDRIRGTLKSHKAHEGTQKLTSEQEKMIELKK